MRWLLALFLVMSACTTPTAKSTSASSPKEAVLGYINALREKRCDQAFAMVEEPMKSLYQKMVQAKGFDATCEAMREQYMPYDRVEYSHEEGTDAKKKVWLRLYRETNDFDPTYVEVEQRGSRWVIVGV